MSSKRRNAGKAVIELSLNDRVAKGLKRLETRFKQFGSNIARIGRVGFVVGATMAAAFVAPVSAASDLEETMNKFNVVFGDNAKTVKAWGDDFAKQVGRSEKQIADFLGSSQDLFVPLGFEEGAATKMSKQITGLAIDLASFNNMADGDTLRDLQAALTGSGEVMKKYGVLVNEAAVKQQLLRDGFDPKTATDQQKVQARLNIIMAGTTAAQGDAIRSAGSYANQMKALKGTLSDLAAEIGGAILPQVTTFVGLLRSGVAGLREFAANNAGLIQMVAMTALVVGGAGSALIAIGLGFKIAAVAAGGLATALGAGVAILGALLSPLGLVAAGIAALVSWFVTATDTGNKMVDDLGTKFGGLLTTVTRVFDGIVAAISTGNIEGAMELLWAGINLIWLKGTQGLSNFWINFKEDFLRITTELVFKAKELWAGLVAAIKKAGIEAKRFGQDALDFVISSLAAASESREDVRREIARLNLGRTSDREREAKADIARINADRDQELVEISKQSELARQNRETRFEQERANLEQSVKDAVAAFGKMEEAVKQATAPIATFGTDEQALVNRIQPVAAGVGTLAAKGIQPQAILDARFAGQQFGGRDKSEELLEEIAGINKKIEKKISPGGLRVS